MNVGAGSGSRASGATNLSAADLEARGQLQETVLVDGALRLAEGVLVEDDAVAIGKPEGAEGRSWFEPLVPGVRIRKELVLPDERTRAAWLTWCGTEADDNETPLHIAVNGVEVVRPPTKYAHPQCRHYYTSDWGGAHFDNWFVVGLPVGALRAGSNTMEMWCDGAAAAGPAAGGAPEAAVAELPAWEVMLAADSERPRGSDPVLPPVGRSARSRDGGATWDGAHLGRGDGCAGEYCVRLHLERHRDHGVFRSAPIDVSAGIPSGEGVRGARDTGGHPGALADRAWGAMSAGTGGTGDLGDCGVAAGDPTRDAAPIHRRLTVSRCQVACDLDLPAGTAAQVRARWADTPRPEADAWSAWEALAGGQGTRAAPPGRWLQVEVELSTDDPLVTPALRGLQVEAHVAVETAGTADTTGTAGMSGAAAASDRAARADPTAAERAPRAPARPHLLAARNGRVVRSSFEYIWEDPEALADLRQRFELDAVVEGAATEFEAQVALMGWAYHIPIGTLDPYAWRYHDLPQLERDGTGAIRMEGPYEGSRRQGHCLYCNLTLIAALLSCGHAARWVNISTKHTYGHEVCEVWSNDFDKWVHLDATRDFYLYDADTGTPLSLTEIGARVGRALREPVTWERPIQSQVTHVDPEPIGLGCRQPGHGIDILLEGGTDLLQMIGHLQMPLRNDFASRPTPVPWRVSSNWGSSQFLTWHSAMFPRKLEYDRSTGRHQDWEPTLNQAEVHLVETATPGQLRVEVDTVTPWWQAFEVRVDDGDWADRSEPAWTWDLHEGLNRLEVRTRNRMGVRGPASELALVLPA